MIATALLGAAVALCGCAGPPATPCSDAQTLAPGERPPLGAAMAAEGAACMRRLSDHVAHAEQMAVHLGSRHQAFNADGSALSFRRGQVVRVADSAIVGQLPAADGVWTWWPRDPRRAFALAGNRVIAHDHVRNVTETVLTLDGRYARFLPESETGEPSTDGRLWIAAAERRAEAGGGKVILRLDLLDGRVIGETALPADEVGRVLAPRWLSALPNGDGFLVGWPSPAGRTQRLHGVALHDRQGRPVRRVTEALVAGDVALDPAGRQWFVHVAAAEPGAGVRLVKAPLDVDGPAVPLLPLADAAEAQVSCLARGAPFCVLGTTSGGRAAIVQVFLDGRVEAQRVRLLARPANDPAGITRHSEAVCPLPPAAALPSPSLDREGVRVLFASNWGDNCFAEIYLIELP